ncbi:hypothetical protein UFOVP449_172 [uncultured Caudovirales phage]|uniref:Uncharacterized protein n=1 Tax=uncultured Caudovirales phage TaxID=2100421 RepID=A0A6J5M9L0_9CAUD|nr:hypothetical protein UFOVP449_172 [uncultured Caudovirales phage]
MKGVITIFCLPQELEDLALTLNTLKRNSVFLDGSIQFKVEITMSLSDELTDWENTKLPKEYIKNRTIELVEKYLDWCECELLWDCENILGCVSQRRYSLQNNPDADFFIWLDTDMFFKDTTLHYVTDTYKLAKSNGLDMVVVTPEFVKQWDDTWDVIVNKKYHFASTNYYKTTDIQKDSLLTSDDVNILQIPTFKFAGGWFTLISKSILDKTSIPESFGHYGLEDTFVMFCCQSMKQRGENISQLVVENLIAGEIHKSRTNNTIKSFIASKDRKEEFRKIAEQNFNFELNSFINR